MIPIFGTLFERFYPENVHYPYIFIGLMMKNGGGIEKDTASGNRMNNP